MAIAQIVECPSQHWYAFLFQQWQYNDGMALPNLQGDDVLDQVLEDEYMAVVQDLRHREDLTSDAAELADV